MSRAFLTMVLLGLPAAGIVIPQSAHASPFVLLIPQAIAKLSKLFAEGGPAVGSTDWVKSIDGARAMAEFVKNSSKVKEEVDLAVALLAIIDELTVQANKISTLEAKVEALEKTAKDQQAQIDKQQQQLDGMRQQINDLQEMNSISKKLGELQARADVLDHPTPKPKSDLQ